MTRPTVFICGDLHNLGDLALLLQNLGVATGGDLKARRWVPLPEEIERQVESAGARLFDGRASGAALAARGADVVIGGGQLVRDNISVRSLAGLLAIVTIARATGGRVTCRGLGVSEIQPGLRRWLWRAVFATAGSVCVRDAVSRRNVAKLCAPAKVRLTADMAFLESDLHTRLRGEAGNRRDVLVVAPCVDASEGRSINGPAFPAVAAAARRRLGISATIYACHDPRPGMDVTAAEGLIAEDDGLATIHDGYQLESLLEVYLMAGLVVTNRLHAAIFALLADRPVLVIDDGAHKIAALTARFSIPSVAANAVLDDAAADALIEAAIAYERQGRSKIKRSLAAVAMLNLRDPSGKA